MYEEHLNEMDKAITECLDRKDVYSRMYKLKTLINGPKIKPQEQAAINDPKTNVLITDEEKIKEVKSCSQCRDFDQDETTHSI